MLSCNGKGNHKIEIENYLPCRETWHLFTNHNFCVGLVAGTYTIIQLTDNSTNPTLKYRYLRMVLVKQPSHVYKNLLDLLTTVVFNVCAMNSYLVLPRICCFRFGEKWEETLLKVPAPSMFFQIFYNSPLKNNGTVIVQQQNKKLTM